MLTACFTVAGFNVRIRDFGVLRPAHYWLPAIAPVGVGLAWLLWGWRAAWPIAGLASVVGVALIAAGAGLWLVGMVRAVIYHLALFSVAAALVALVLAPGLGLAAGFGLFVASAACFVIAGWAGCLAHAVSPGAGDVPTASPVLAAKVAMDSALLGFYINAARSRDSDELAADVSALKMLETLAETRGWRAHPARVHPCPNAPTDAHLAPVVAARHKFEWLTFDAGYEVDGEWPGAERFATFFANRRMAARVFRHTDARADRPWLVCIHGYRMGTPRLDMDLFRIKHLHQHMGLNVLMPILPLHGVRRATRLSGGLYFDSPLADLMHIQAQALWDLRRCLAWLRAVFDAPSVGVLGASLGGYNAALLAAFEPALSPIICAVPVVDLPGVLFTHMATPVREQLRSAGFDGDRVSNTLAPVAPLTYAAAQDQQRFIIGASHDQVVPPAQTVALWHHWDGPSALWYHGTHLSIRREAGVWPFINDALAAL